MSSRAERLIAYLASVRAQRFRPGTHDCGMFVAGWVLEATGADHGARWRGRYRSMESIAEIMRDEGFDGHLEYVASLFPEVAPARARAGDIAVVDGSALGVVSGDRVFVLRPDGLGSVSRLRAVRAFAVGGF